MVTASLIGSAAAVGESAKGTLCVECGKPWLMQEGERKWWLEQTARDPKTKMPTRCLPCRKNSKPMGRGCVSSMGKPKVRYESLEQAKYVEEQHRKDRGFSKQYAYECPDCFGFHLTSVLPLEIGAPRISQMNYNNRYDTSKDKHVRGRHGETRTKVRDLIESGLRVADVAKKLDYSPTTVYYHLREMKANPSSKPSSVENTLKSLSDIASRRQRLEEQINALALEEKRLNSEAERLRREEMLSMVHSDGEYAVRQKAQRMSFTVDTFRELIREARRHEQLRQVLSEVA